MGNSAKSTGSSALSSTSTNFTVSANTGRMLLCTVRGVGEKLEQFNVIQVSIDGQLFTSIASATSRTRRQKTLFLSELFCLFDADMPAAGDVDVLIQTSSPPKGLLQYEIMEAWDMSQVVPHESTGLYSFDGAVLLLQDGN